MDEKREIATLVTSILEDITKLRHGLEARTSPLSKAILENWPNEYQDGQLFNDLIDNTVQEIDARLIPSLRNGVLLNNLGSGYDADTGFSSSKGPGTDERLTGVSVTLNPPEGSRRPRVEVTVGVTHSDLSRDALEGLLRRDLSGVPEPSGFGINLRIDC